MFSWVAIDRFAEKERAKDATFRKQSADKVLRSDAQPLTDDDLLAKLRSFGIELDRPSLERLCREAFSAEEIATPLLDQRTFHGRQAEMESDWIWVCFTALWQRWFPDQPCFELLDDKMEAGYELQGPGRDAAACRILGPREFHRRRWQGDAGGTRSCAHQGWRHECAAQKHPAKRGWRRIGLSSH